MAPREFSPYNTAVEEALRSFPKKILDSLTVRPMEKGDESALVEFFKNIPVDERHLFKDDVTSKVVIQKWCRKLNYENILPLLVFDGSRIVADATLHRDRRGWSRHVATLRVSLDPAYRRRGLAGALIKEFLNLATPFGVAILRAEILDIQKGARALFEERGFLRVATLPQNAIDLAGRVHDLLVYNYTVTPPERGWRMVWEADSITRPEDDSYLAFHWGAPWDYPSRPSIYEHVHICG